MVAVAVGHQLDVDVPELAELLGDRLVPREVVGCHLEGRAVADEDALRVRREGFRPRADVVREESGVHRDEHLGGVHHLRQAVLAVLGRGSARRFAEADVLRGADRSDHVHQVEARDVDVGLGALDDRHGGLRGAQPAGDRYVGDGGGEAVLRPLRAHFARLVDAPLREHVLPGLGVLLSVAEEADAAADAVRIHGVCNLVTGLASDVLV